MENTNVISDTQQAVVAPATEDYCGADSGTPEKSTNTAGVADRVQSRADNSKFRKLRLENEGYRKEIESLRAQLSGLSRLEELEKQNSAYLDRLVSDKMKNDLELLQSMNPRLTKLSDAGEQFIRLIENGIDVKTAYAAVLKASEGTQMPAAPVTGAVGSTEGSAPRYFTSKELDRLTKKQLENPAIFKKAMESLRKL